MSNRQRENGGTGPWSAVIVYTELLLLVNLNRIPYKYAQIFPTSRPLQICPQIHESVRPPRNLVATKSAKFLEKSSLPSSVPCEPQNLNAVRYTQHWGVESDLWMRSKRSNGSKTCKISFDMKKRPSVSDRLSTHRWMIIWKCTTNLRNIICIQIRSQNYYSTTCGEALSNAVKGGKSEVGQEVAESGSATTKTLH